MGMKLKWVAALACVSALAAAHPLSDSTQKTLVVAKADDTVTVPAATEQPEPTTDEPYLPIKLNEMKVTSVVTLRYAHTAVVAHVENPDKRAQEADFRVLLPKTAFISGFVMTLDGKSYKAYVKEKEEAQKIYNQAVSQGSGAAHVKATVRDSNQFVVSVNVEPLTTAVFNLTYEELLTRRHGVYNHAINLHPGALVPKLSVTVNIKETQKITTLRVPEIRTGNEIDASASDAQNTKAVIERAHDDKEATIRFTPDLKEQQRLMDIYAVKSKESSRNVEEGKGVLGQFVVQYDVDRPKEGEILVNDGYFVHFFAPSDLLPLPKHVVFLLDCSDSMRGRKIEQLRQAMQLILSELKPGDFFNIISFSSLVWVHELTETSPVQFGQSRQTLEQPSPATAENIARAKTIIGNLGTNGVTNIYSALDTAINLIQNGATRAKQANNESYATPADPSVGTDLKNIGPLEKLETIVIFLTDGVPNSGVTDPTTLVNVITEKNSGFNKASIFTLSFGEDADRKFLRKLSLRNNGFMRHIYEAADAALQLQDFYKRVSSPLLADVKFTYPEAQIDEKSLTRNIFKTYYEGSEVIVAGKVVKFIPLTEGQVVGYGSQQNSAIRKRYVLRRNATVSTTRQEYLPLERLWSYLTIKQLLDEKDAADSNEKKEDAKKKALDLALKYEFVTPMTSLVVVKPNAINAVDAESADKPHHSEPRWASTSWPVGGYRAFISSSYSGISVAVQISSSRFGAYQQPYNKWGMLEYPNSIPVPHYYPSWTFPTPTKSAPTSTPASTRPLELYHLQDYAWAEPLLNVTMDALVLNDIAYKLTRDVNAPNLAPGEVPCASAVGGGAGRCVYLTRCSSAKGISVPLYSAAHCSIDGYAGVCCSENDIRKVDTNPSA